MASRDWRTLLPAGRANWLAGLLCVLISSAGGCHRDPYANVRYRDDPVKFRDDAASNQSIDEPLEDSLTRLSFVDLEGRPTDLSQYRGRKAVVLVVTRGYGAGICLYCATQTSRLITNYEEFAKREAEVVVVFPVEGEEGGKEIEAFLSSTYDKLDEQPRPTPFPLVLDPGLKAVDRLGIRQELSKPATFILDKAGRVRFAYVGETISDRPSLVAMLTELDRLRAEDGADADDANADSAESK